MRLNVISQLAASGLLVTTLCSSFLPSLVQATELDSEQAQYLTQDTEDLESTVDLDSEMTLPPEALTTAAEETLEDATPATLGLDPVTDGSDNVSKKEITQALENIEGLLDDSSDVVVTKDADSAAIVTTEAGTTVDLPKDPSDAVVLSSEDSPAIEITLPQADESKKAKTIDEGVVAYPGKDGSANAIQATEDGGVKMLTIIDNSGAPTDYTYGITVPEGGRVELTGDGGALVVENDGSSILVITPPWATDAAGTSLETYFTTDGVSLTQHVLHNVEGVVYPVTADPWGKPAMVDRVEWVKTQDGWSLHVYMTWYGFIASKLDPSAAFREVMQKACITWTRKFFYQFACHVQFAYPWKESWNLDLWRPDVSYAQTLLYACNPN